MNNIFMIWNILNLNLEKYKIIICDIEKDNILEFHIKWINHSQKMILNIFMII